MQKPLRICLPLFISLPMLVGVCQVSIAARVDYSMGINAEYTDNSNLQSTNQVDDLKQSALLGLSVQESSASITSDIRTLIEYNNYRDDTFADETLVNLNGDLLWTIRPSSFFWVVEDYYSQIKRDVLDAATPNNLIDTNVFSTGPDLVFRLNPVNSIEVNARGSTYSFEDTNVDSNRSSFNLAWVYAVSSFVDISANAGYQEARFTEIDDADFERQDYFIRINSEYSRSHVEIHLGKSIIDREYFEDIDGYLTRFIWRNQFRAQSYFQLDASTQYTDSGQDLLSENEMNEEVDRTGTQVSGDIYYDKRVDAIYHFASGLSSYDIQLTYRNEDFELVPQDRVSRSSRINYNYLYSSTSQISGFLEHSENKSIDTSQVNKLNTGGLAIDYRLTRKYTFRFEYVYSSQESNVPTAEYDENRILVSFYYGINPQSYR